MTRTGPLARIGSYAIVAVSPGELFSRLVSYIGAGVYEETMFRLMLLPLTTAIFRTVGFKPRPSVLLAAVVTSLLFSAAHHVGAHGEPFDAFRFTFRFAAGMMFCACAWARIASRMASLLP